RRECGAHCLSTRAGAPEFGRNRVLAATLPTSSTRTHRFLPPNPSGLVPAPASAPLGLVCRPELGPATRTPAGDIRCIGYGGAGGGGHRCPCSHHHDSALWCL